MILIFLPIDFFFIQGSQIPKPNIFSDTSNATSPPQQANTMPPNPISTTTITSQNNNPVNKNLKSSSSSSSDSEESSSSDNESGTQSQTSTQTQDESDSTLNVDSIRFDII